MQKELSALQRVQASDGYFFEQFAASTTPIPPTVIGSIATVDDESRLNDFRIDYDNQAFEDLYVEALYTIVHKVGRCESAPVEELFSYAQKAFRIDDAQHQQLLSRAHEEKVIPPVVLLNVLLLEARDLIAKDVNGFSDPFSMMGVVPGKRPKGSSPDPLAASKQALESDSEDTTNSDVECAIPPRSPAAIEKQRQYTGLLHRFGGSFRRNTANKKKKDEARMIPVKRIKASSVQRKTLNPKWNEKFQFVVDDVNSPKY
ncbi:unnamed protein product [Gongylonema pulchrum]|uniref:C2 domain-containing protein n=1 Tax=Gongylonema pulchrum TaxID=637853 RepID=A0A183EBT9_9BILA|nr:unnamed protein product [Gongylonema pulchrum]